MKLVLAIYMNKNISEVIGNFGEKLDDATIDISLVKAMCENGNLRASIELADDVNEVHIKLKDNINDKEVILESLKMRSE